MTRPTGRDVPSVSVIIVTYNAREIIEECLVHLKASVGIGAPEIIIVDNASHDSTVAYLSENHADVRLVLNEVNVGFGRACNQGLQNASGDIIFLLNTDAYLDSHAISTAVEWFMTHPKCGIMGGEVYDAEGNYRRSGLRFPTVMGKMFQVTGMTQRYKSSPLFNRSDYQHADDHSAYQVDWVSGCFTGLRRRMLEELNGFDPRFFFYFEEVDLCHRAKEIGWEVWVLPEVKVRHEGGRSARERKSEGITVFADQILPWALRAEKLYNYKHKGLFVTAWATALEVSWYCLGYVKNCTNNSEHAKMRRGQYSDLIREHYRALVDTRCGTRSPPQPW